MYYFDSNLYTFVKFWYLKTSILEFLAEINEYCCLHNNIILNVLQMAELLVILGLHNRSSQ